MSKLIDTKPSGPWYKNYDYWKNIPLEYIKAVNKIYAMLIDQYDRGFGFDVFSGQGRLSVKIHHVNICQH